MIIIAQIVLASDEEMWILIGFDAEELWKAVAVFEHRKRFFSYDFEKLVYSFPVNTVKFRKMLDSWTSEML